MDSFNAHPSASPLRLCAETKQDTSRGSDENSFKASMRNIPNIHVDILFSNIAETSPAKNFKKSAKVWVCDASQLRL